LSMALIYTDFCTSGFSAYSIAALISSFRIFFSACQNSLRSNTWQT
jgi:hypothetical protein